MYWATRGRQHGNYHVGKICQGHMAIWSSVTLIGCNVNELLGTQMFPADAADADAVAAACGR